MDTIQDIIAAIEPSKTNEHLLRQLTGMIDQLILTDFPALTRLLYRLDIDENKLKRSMEGVLPQEKAGVIAGMIIERQLEKQRTRQQFKQSGDETGEERW